MKIFTSYFANLTALKNCGITPISIARYSPRNWTGERMTWLAPTPYMISGKCPHEEYVEKYREICQRVNVEWFLKQLNQIGGGGDVALLCYERPGDFCHRHMLAEHLNSLGLDVKEFNAIIYMSEQARGGTKPPNPEPPKPDQLSLF